MNYTIHDVLPFMDSGVVVRATTKDRRKYEGKCWVYDSDVSRKEFGMSEPCVDIGSSTILRLSEICSMEYVELTGLRDREIL